MHKITVRKLSIKSIHKNLKKNQGIVSTNRQNYKIFNFSFHNEAGKAYEMLG
jgi:hypothetical protein